MKERKSVAGSHPADDVATGKHPVSPPPDREDWRCTSCGGLLGRRGADGVHIKGRPHAYLAPVPIYSSCGKCGALNHLI